MGVVESICLAILVGMSVDYVMHVGIAFVAAPVALGRRERASYALSSMGAPVCMGAASTIAATIFLFQGTVTFFPAFGLFMCIT